MSNVSAAIPLRDRSVSVVVPALNEAENLAPTIERLIDALAITIEDFEIIIVDDGSTDRTAEIAEQLRSAAAQIRVIHNPRRMGLGYCYTRGYQEATKNHFVYIPGDNSWPYRSFVELFGNLGRADIITSYAINPEVRPFARRFISHLYTKILNFLFRQDLQYFNGLTIYPVDFLRRGPATTFGFGFQAEVLLKAIYSGYSYIEVGLPIDDRAAGASKAVSIRNIFSVASTIVRLLYELHILKKWRPTSQHHVRITPQASGLALEELGLNRTGEHEPDSIADKDHPPRTIVITGASSGIGAALARNLAAEGHSVFACSRSIKNLENAFAAAPQVFFFACDVTNPDELDKFVAFVRGHVEKIEILINCAGRLGTIGTIESIDDEEWIQTVHDNLFATFLPIKKFLPLLRAADGSQIINFSGGGAFSPFPNFSAYACAKAAIVRLTETLAMELAPHGIAVNALAPGVIRTKVQEQIVAAGPSKAGQVQYLRSEHLIRRADKESEERQMGAIFRCVRALISEPYRGLTGKTLSANFDPWSTAEFRLRIADISRSELYTMRRTNIVNLPRGLLRASLMMVWKKYGLKQ